MKHRHGIALTGAGISVESGVPDFRSPGGLWERFDPMEYATIQAFCADPHRVWEMLGEMDKTISAARPNPAHLALADLEKAGVLSGIITQNIDNLHQNAGSKQVMEFHGNASRLRCLKCNSTTNADQHETIPPLCECGEILKPDVIFFGESIPQEAFRQSTELANTCKTMLIVGTSATVVPASMLPMLAKANGALLVEFNLGPTEITHACDIAIHTSASKSLSWLAKRVKELSY
ncbi:MAG: NAD-dependent deacylase [Pseudomonadota bacterium]